MIKAKGREPWTTQLFIKGHSGNRHDALYNALGDQRSKSAVTVDFAPINDSRLGELAARFDIIPGLTPEG